MVDSGPTKKKAAARKKSTKATASKATASKASATKKAATAKKATPKPATTKTAKAAPAKKAAAKKAPATKKKATAKTAAKVASDEPKPAAKRKAASRSAEPQDEPKAPKSSKSASQDSASSSDRDDASKSDRPRRKRESTRDPERMSTRAVAKSKSGNRDDDSDPESRSKGHADSGNSNSGNSNSGGKDSGGGHSGGGDSRQKDHGHGHAGGGDGGAPGEGTGRRRRRRRRGRGKNRGEGHPDGEQPGQDDGPKQGAHAKQAGHSKPYGKPNHQAQQGQGGGKQGKFKKGPKPHQGGPIPEDGEGMFLLDKGGFGVLRQKSQSFRPSKDDIYVPKNLIQKGKLRDGMLVKGRLTRGQKHQFQLADILEIDGEDPKSMKRTRPFKTLTSIDPDFHYACGDALQDTSMRIVDLLCPIGRGQRGLIVAPPRSGKTTIMRTFAKGIAEAYPDVHLMVLLVDERPEEATEWSRSITKGEVFSSTSDETAKTHIQMAEAVWKRACHLVEKGEDVVLLLDSLTRLARAFNNQLGSGKTMSGGLDSRAMERPRKIFGSARNTVEAGSLTILGTILVDTGSKMDQLVFEDFKGTGNMELVLNRKLADRRVFPAIDVEKSGTRKEEKLVGMRRLKQIHTLRRVLSRLHYVEAVEMLITRLDEVDKTDDFLNRFTIDPEA